VRREAQREALALQAIQVTWGLARFPMLSAELLRQGSEAAARGDLAGALALYEEAAGYAPGSVDALVGRAALQWQMDKSRILEIGRALGRGLWNATQDGRWGLRLSSNLLLSLLIAWLAVLVLLAGILAVKIQPLLSHDLVERVCARAPPSSQWSLGLLVLLLPLLAGLGLFWAAALSLVISAPYLMRRERWVVSAILAVLVVLPMGYQRVAAAHLVASSPHLAAAQAAEEGGRADGLLRELRRWAEHAPEAGLPRYYLGLVLRRRGELPQAEAAMIQAVQRLPDSGFAQVGLGNVQYLQGRFAEAEATYRQAAEVQRSSAAAQLNLVRLYSQRLQLDQANEALARAARLDSRMVRMVAEFHGQGLAGFVLDEPVPWNALAGSLLPPAGEIAKLAEGLWGTPLRGIRLQHLPAVAGAILVAFWAAVAARRGVPPARRCVQCGVAFCGKCQPLTAERDYCRPCAAVFRSRETVAAFVRIRRIQESEEWGRRQRVRVGLLAILLPGGGDLYRGRILGGLLLALPAVWFVVEGVLLDALTPSFRFADPIPGPIRGTVVVLALLALVAISMRRAWSKPTPLSR
jgi:tetratricopeptide (TPR) repeat protein